MPVPSDYDGDDITDVAVYRPGDGTWYLLPSSAGRTTMCPTELLYDGSEAPCVRLLPIETRLESTTVAVERATNPFLLQLA